MMYNEFLELTGLSESQISFLQYAEDIEPAYTWLNFNDKKHFCEFFLATGFELVSEISNNLTAKMQMQKDYEFLQNKNHELVVQNYDLKEDMDKLKYKLKEIREIIRK